MTPTITTRGYGQLEGELEAIASCELAEPLAHWGAWTPAQAEKLADYLRDELQNCGMLDMEGKSRERAEARRLIDRIDRQLEELVECDSCKALGEVDSDGNADGWYYGPRSAEDGLPSHVLCPNCLDGESERRALEGGI